MSSKENEDYPPVLSIDCKKSFNQLNDKEKLFAYYLSKACYEGNPIIWHQVSIESPAVFIIFQEFFSSFKKNSDFSIPKDLYTLLQQKIPSLTIPEYMEVIIYVSKFFANSGNYTSFGHKKVIPKLSKEKLEEILKTSDKYESNIKPVWEKYKDLIYNNEKEFQSINLEEKGGKSSYYLNHVKNSETEFIDKILEKTETEITFTEYKTNKQITRKEIVSNLNTRILKLSEKIFVVLVSSINKSLKLIYDNEKEFGKIYLYYGEFNNYLSKIIFYLEKAIQYSNTELEKEMLHYYIQYFITGSIPLHKESQIKWVQNKKPIVEINMGWVESYIDPNGIRTTYEGWVSVSDKEKSKCLDLLISNSEKILKKLPYPSNFERDDFHNPEFISMDMLSAAIDGCPLGINIPNYEDVQTNYGFKNLNISNSYPPYNKNFLPFITDEDIKIMSEFCPNADLLVTAGHELLGHGSLKNFRIDENGKYNFDINTVINPLTNEKIKSFYKVNETFESLFKSTGRAFEETRAETTGLFLLYDEDFCKIFGVNDKITQENFIYSQYLFEFRKGIGRLDIYDINTKNWNQAHTQTSFVIAMYFLEKQKEKNVDILKIENCNVDNKPYFYVKVNKDNLIKYGKEIIADLLLHLSVYKATADFNEGVKFYEKYSAVNEEFLKLREIVVNTKFERRVELYHNMILDEKENKVSYKEYEAILENIVQSNIERFDENTVKDVEEMLERYNKDEFKNEVMNLK